MICHERADEPRMELAAIQNELNTDEY